MPTQAHGWRGLERPKGATTRAVGRPLTGEAEREGCCGLFGLVGLTFASAASHQEAQEQGHAAPDRFRDHRTAGLTAG